MFTNMKISAKLIAAFSLMAAVLLGVGIVSIKCLAIQARNTELIADVRLPSIAALGKAEQALNNIQRQERNLFVPEFIKDEKERIRHLNRLEAAWKKAEESLQRYEALPMEKEEEVLWTKLKPAWAQWRKGHEKVIENLENGKRSEALRLTRDKTRESLDEAEKLLGQLVSLNEKYAIRDHEQAIAQARTSKIITLISVLLGILLALACGIFISRNITKPLRKLVSATESLSTGDVNVRIEVKRGDEIGLLAQSFTTLVETIRDTAETVERIAAGDLTIEAKVKSEKDILGKSIRNVVDALRGLIAEAGILSTAAVEGRLTTRGTADKFPGDFRKIVQGVNETLDAVIGPLNVAAKYVDHISKGNIPQKITDSYNGDFNEIKNNLNQCVDAVNMLVADANMLSNAAVQGKLATRADAGKHGGDFRKIVQGVNETLDAVIGPLNVAAKYVDRISKGELPDAITDHYSGDFDAIKNNLNRLVETLANRGNDINFLIDSAIQGRLDYRADTSKYGGIHKGAIDGVNRLLDAVIDPLKVAANYVYLISKGEIPPRITDSYNGDFNEIKNNLNHMLDYLSGTAGAANRVAQGDLTVVVTPHSEKDLLGNAFAQMVANLRQLAGQMRETTDSINSATMSISSSMSQQSATVSEEAASVAETTATVEEVRQTADQSAERAQIVSEMAANTLTMAENGLQAVKKGEQGMLSLKEQVRNIAETILALSEQTQQIGEIIASVNDISDQSHLLALNAAMEAARAGEAGRGFAVVAGEVRNLAEQSRQATAQISGILSEIQKSANTAVMVTEQGSKSAEVGVVLTQSAGEAISAIREHTQQVATAAQQIAASSRQQLTGMDQITRAMENINLAASQTQTGMQQAEMATQKLNDLAKSMGSIVGQYKIA